MVGRALAVGLGVIVAACGGGDADTSPPVDAVLETSAIVIETPGQEPMIAFFLLESYPPQGGDVALASWSWDDVDGEESVKDTTWGGPYRLLGTWDGEEFTLTETPTTGGPLPETLTFEELTPGCQQETFMPVLEHFATLDYRDLGIVTTGEYVFDGHCGAYVQAAFDTDELRDALEPHADQITLDFYFVPVEDG